MGDMEQKLSAFGFEVRKINGHDHDDIYHALCTEPMNKPLAIIAKTIRGYGSDTMIRESKWFHRSPNDNELSDLIKEVDAFEKPNV
jgi:transketolase